MGQDLAASADARHIAMDGKTIRASKDGEGKTVHVLSAFCGGLQKVLARGIARQGHRNSGCAQASACDQRREAVRARFGTLTGVFLIGYGLARIVGELFRQPDAFLGFLFAGATMGQILSLPMVFFGIWLVRHGRAARPV